MSTTQKTEAPLAGMEEQIDARVQDATQTDSASPSLEELASKTSKVKQSLKKIGVKLYTSVSGKTSEDLNRAYENIGIPDIESQLLRNMTIFLNKLRGKDAKKFMKEYSKEAQKMYKDFDDMIFSAQNTLLNKERLCNKTGVDFWVTRSNAKSVEQLVEMYDRKMYDINESFKSLNNADDATVNALCDEYARHLLDDKTMEPVERKNSLMYVLANKKMDLKGAKTEQETYKRNLDAIGKEQETTYFRQNELIKLAEAHLKNLQMKVLPTLTYIRVETQQTDMGFDVKKLYQEAQSMTEKVKKIQTDVKAYLEKTKADIDELEHKDVGEMGVVPKNLDPFQESTFVNDIGKKYGALKVDNEQSEARMAESMFGGN